MTVYDSDSFVGKTNTWINYTPNMQGDGYMYIIHPNCPHDYCLPPFLQLLTSTNPMELMLSVISTIQACSVVSVNKATACRWSKLLDMPQALAYYLHITLEIFSFTTINYPNNTYEIVWLSDANVKYFQGKHIALVLIGFALLIMLLGYTIILLLWQWLLRAPNITAFKWVRNTKLNCFIEAYHAPYRPKYHFWTCILLLLRVILDILISLNISGSPQYNLLTTGIVIGSLVMLKTYIYR